MGNEEDERGQRVQALFRARGEAKVRKETELLGNIKGKMVDLGTLLEKASSHWNYEDPIYRFYHQSWKVYHLQDLTQEIVAQLQALLPQEPLNAWFVEIIQKGTGKRFREEHNQNWTRVTRPILEAFFHARFFLEMTIKYGKELEEPQMPLPSGWAAVLYLYNLR